MAKRETNAQRTAREWERRTTLQVAYLVAELIRERRQSKAELAPEHKQDLPAKELKKWGWHPESKGWWRNYTYLGQTFCELCPFDQNPAEFLRLVADALEGKWPPYSPGNDWYDDKITAAYGEARSRLPRPRPKDGAWSGRMPYFSEFLDIFRRQNPKLKRIEDRSLRRSLKRLGYPTEPDKRGRPKKK